MKLIIDDRIRNREVEFFNSFSLNLIYNSVGSSFSFDWFYNPENKEHVELGLIGHYHIAKVEHNGQRLLRGYILSTAFSDASQKQLTKITGYSVPGVINDCTIPPDSYPLQYDGLTLREIAQKLVAPFDFSIVVDGSVSSLMDQVIDKTTANNTESIQSYLSSLCKQKNIVMSNDVNGNLLFTRAKTNLTPILNFDGGIPFTKMTLTFNGQPMHSHITVMKQASADGGNAGQFTIRNPYVPFVYRPKVVLQNSGDDNNTQQAAQQNLANELKNFKLVIETDRWEIDGKVIMPNNTILVQNPEISLFHSTKWFIESVQLKGDEKKTTATLNCVIPEVYNGQTPRYIYEGINLH